MKIVFFGTPAFSCPFLRALIDNPLMQVIAVVTQPDKPAGRGGHLAPSPVKRLAADAGIPVLDPESLKHDAAAVKALRATQADIFVVVAYGKLLPATVLAIPRLGCVNVHPSLLPRHRGPSPMQWTIREGDRAGGVTTMLLDAGMDTGHILAQQEVAISQDETYGSLQQKIEALGPRLMVETLTGYESGRIKPVPQDESRATLTRMLERQDGRVDWQQDAGAIERLARAYEAWPGLWSVWNRSGSPVRLKLRRVSNVQGSGTPGLVQVRDGRLLVGAGEGIIEVIEIQPEGRPLMSATAFLAGYGDIKGAVLT